MKSFPFHSICMSLFWLFAWTYQVHGQDDIRFRQLSTKQGLSQSTVFAILQDRYGFMWIATSDGLNRYDGYQFEYFKQDSTNPASLPDSWVNCLLEDSQGRLWVGTFQYGLARLRPNRQEFDTLDLGLDNDSQGLSQNLIKKLLEVEPGTIWAGLDHHGIVVISDSTETVSYKRHDPSIEGSLRSDRLRDLILSYDGSVWVSTSEGLDYYDKQLARFIPFQQKADDGMIPTRTTKILEDSKQRLWIGTESDGLFLLDLQTSHLRHFKPSENQGSSSNISALHLDTDGQLWVGTQNQGLSRYNVESDHFNHYRPDLNNSEALRDYTVLSICEDRSGLIWVGTYSEGIAQFNRHLQGFRHVRSRPDKNSLNGNMVTGFMEDDDGSLWVATRKSGLSLLEPEGKTYTHFQHQKGDENSLSSDSIRHVMRDSKGIVWVATDFGLNQKAAQGSSFRQYLKGESGLNANTVMHILEDESQRFWLATYEGGLNLMDRDTEQFAALTHDPAERNTISSNFVNYLYLDKAERMWLGTEDGLNLLDRSNMKFTYYQNDPDDVRSLGHDSVMVMYQRAQNRQVLWVGTYGGGLNKFNIRTGTFRRYSIHDGLANNSIYGIMDDALGRLWISTNGGISRFNPDNDSFRNYNTSNGLVRNEFNRNAFLQKKDGQLLFGGFGYTMLNPLAITINQHAPQMAITWIKKSNQELKLDSPLAELSKLVLNHDDHVISLAFAALDFNSPEKNKFQHKLEGFSDKWVSTGGHNEISYTNLAPGDYLLRIKGANNDNVWNNEGIRLEIEVRPPIWRTWRAYSLYLLLLAAAVGAGIRYQVLQSNRELQRAMSLGKAEFATTVLHNIGNVLNSVKLSCDKNASLLRASKVKQLLRAQDLLRENLDNVAHYLTEDPRGKLLPGYFKSAGEMVTEEYGVMLRECDEMSEAVALMKDIIETQQAHASISLIDEAHNLNEVVRDALKVQENGLRSRGIQIEEQLRPLPPVKVPKTQLMHIVINLVKNARESMETNGDREKRLLLETGKYGNNEVYLRIKDTGLGISKENLAKMFSYGFTTKKEGHGFGLNYCSRAMKRMGGAIEVESEGLGKGASFTLMFRANVSD